MDAFTELTLNRFGDDEGGGVILTAKAFSRQHVMVMLNKCKKLKVFYFSSKLAKDEATGTTDQFRALACACFCAAHS
eukprot:5864838-Pleurochrysis_carterae.AAC.1